MKLLCFVLVLGIVSPSLGFRIVLNPIGTAQQAANNARVVANSALNGVPAGGIKNAPHSITARPASPSSPAPPSTEQRAAPQPGNIPFRPKNVVHSAANIAQRATAAVASAAAAASSSLPPSGPIVNTANGLLSEMTSAKGIMRMISKAVTTTVNLLGRDKLVNLARSLRDAFLAAATSAQQILDERLPTTPVIGHYFKSSEDIYQTMNKYGQPAGVPQRAIDAAYTVFLVGVNGVYSVAGLAPRTSQGAPVS